MVEMQYLDLPEIEMLPEQLVTLPIVRAWDYYKQQDLILLTPSYIIPIILFKCEHGAWVLESDIPDCDKLWLRTIKFPPNHESCNHSLYRVKIVDPDPGPLRHFSEHAELELLKRSIGMFLIAKFSGYSAILYIPNVPSDKTVVVYEFDRLSARRRLFVSYQDAIKVFEGLKGRIVEKEAFFIPVDVKLLQLSQTDP
jgi:hypothetical protein